MLVRVQSQESMLHELWGPISVDFEKDVFVMLTGYIDESYTGEQKPLTFGLNCLFARGNEWYFIANAWEKVIERKNAELIAAGRKPVKRFHAVDLNNFVGDFADWDGDERTAFTKQIIHKVFALHYVLSVGYTINLAELSQLWPEVGENGISFAYDIMLRLIMIYLAKTIPERFPRGAQITLIHERCPYDSVLLGAFNRSIRKAPLHGDIFTSIAPMGWERCVPLQAADFIAYEAMKETNRLRPSLKQRGRRLSLSALLELDTFGAISEEIPGEVILDWKRTVDASTMKQIRSESEIAIANEEPDLGAV
jgi:hypothetical protein